MSFRLKAALLAAAIAVPGAALAADMGHPTVTITKKRHVESGVQIGTLTCKSPGGIGYIVGSDNDLACEYRPAGAPHPVDAYMGRLSTIGVDVGATGPSVLKWAVVTRTEDIGPGDLAGRYRGASISAAALIGGGANVLLGGSGRSIALQPLSFEGQTGLSVSAGLSSLTLDPV
ncbi:DUF992 domain-containing protein [Methylopila turkensis]|uniref:DUF992 domain-containing protein n=1 Tax=Methylopila turkensis TaxID=1437816 RepID=A0A9W6N8E2_9HYPH|nr:DUF992 domain-containing protein [Methylopila turkensis]GLK81415.1 hypothetical protein GCM10008174_31560 [Methylopila turkensis]